MRAYVFRFDQERHPICSIYEYLPKWRPNRLTNFNGKGSHGVRVSLAQEVVDVADM